MEDGHEYPAAIDGQHGDGPTLGVSPEATRPGQGPASSPAAMSGSAENRSTNRSSACRERCTVL